MTDDISLFLIGAFIAFAIVYGIRRFAGFPAQEPQDYAHLVPSIDLRENLRGTLLCRGMIFGPTGRVTSRFEAVMRMTWDGDSGSMEEDFLYDDGTRQSRSWHLTVLEDGWIRAEASDVIGTARGRQCGNAFGMRYRIVLPPENGGHTLDAVDWMYLQPDGTILNRSQFRKFGIKVAELFATITPMEDDDA